MMHRSAIILAGSMLFATAANANPDPVCSVQTGWIEQGKGSAALVIAGILGHREVRMLIDSGVPKTTFDDTLASEIKNISHAGERVSAYGGDVSINHADGAVITVGNHKTHLKDIEVTSLSKINALGSGIDLILGRDVLNNCAIRIDSDHGKFRIEESDGETDRSPGAVRIPIVYDQGIPKVRVGLGNGKAFSALVDTGMRAGLIVDQGTWSVIGPKNLRHTSVISAGLGGWLVSGLVVAPTISIGSFELKDVDIRIDPRTDGGGEPQIGTGVIGTDILEMANFIIDFRRRSMTISARASPSLAHVKSTSGVLASQVGDRLRILHVMESSPAAEAGITDKDQICKVDGQAISSDYSASPMRVWSRDRPGRVIRLTLCDGRAKQVMLREFY